MLKLDSGCLICDFAETYHVLDMRALPLKTAAVLACGLRDNSRIKMKLGGQNVSLETLILARIADSFTLFLWGERAGKPPLITEALTEIKEEAKELEFSSAESFEKARLRIIKGDG